MNQIGNVRLWWKFGHPVLQKKILSLIGAFCREKWPDAFQCQGCALKPASVHCNNDENGSVAHSGRSLSTAWSTERQCLGGSAVWSVTRFYDTWAQCPSTVLRAQILWCCLHSFTTAGSICARCVAHPVWMRPYLVSLFCQHDDIPSSIVLASDECTSNCYSVCKGLMRKQVYVDSVKRPSAPPSRDQDPHSEPGTPVPTSRVPHDDTYMTLQGVPAYNRPRRKNAQSNKPNVTAQLPQKKINKK